MHFCFGDDAEQRNVTRRNMRGLVGAGGIFVDSNAMGELHERMDQLCEDAGFPSGPAGEFKWSPGRELWMWDNLVGDERTNFFKDVVDSAAESGAFAAVVVVDVEASPATNANSPEEDATRLFLERASNRFSDRHGGVVIVDRPSGGRSEENKFLASCIEHLEDQATFAVPERFAIPPIATQSRLIRLLQAADVITSCTLAYVGGESRWAPGLFERIRPMLARELGRAGGVGLKIHPDFRYANLYYWLLGDDVWVKRGGGVSLPRNGLLYATDDGMTG